MKSNAVKFLIPNPLLSLMVLASSFLVPMCQAQQVYRSVGQDGKVTFSDQPPPDKNAKISAPNGGSTGAEASVALPFELRQIAAKYPVTLYAGDNCAPCDAGRSLLTRRGIPFTEKTVTTNEDAQTLQRLSGDSSLPFMTIGSQQFKGFSSAEWTQYLNAAGYPSSSVLPSSYRPPTPTPLVAIAKAAPPAATASANTPIRNGIAKPAATPTSTPDNPAGIKF